MKALRALATSIVLLASANANAVLIEITATEDAAVNNGVYSDWVLVFDDVNGDGLLQLSELVTFSGIDLLTGGGSSFTTLIGTPDVAGVSTQTGFISIGQSPILWYLDFPTSTANLGLNALRWTYVSRVVGNGGSDPNGVPAPGTLVLLGMGLAAIGLARRRRQRA